MDPADTPADAAELYQEYLSQEATFQSGADELRLRIESALEAAGLSTAMQVTARHKRPLELFKKQRRKNYVDPWADCPDLVGARIVVSVSSDKTAVVDALRGAPDLRVVNVEDQSENADPDALAYRGLHVHVTSDGLVNRAGRKVRCEVQIRTIAEHSWAETEHKYVYKKRGNLPTEIVRVFSRLLVLVELFDEQLAKGVEMVKENPGFAEFTLVRDLEDRFEGLANLPGDENSTVDVIRQITELTGRTSADLQELVAVSFDSVQKTLQTLLQDHGPNAAGFEVESGWLTTQPEILLILALLSTDEYSLSSKLAESDLYALIEPIAIWTGHDGYLRD